MIMCREALLGVSRVNAYLLCHRAPSASEIMLRDVRKIPGSVKKAGETCMDFPILLYYLYYTNTLEAKLRSGPHCARCCKCMSSWLRRAYSLKRNEGTSSLRSLLELRQAPTVAWVSRANAFIHSASAFYTDAGRPLCRCRFHIFPCGNKTSENGIES